MASLAGALGYALLLTLAVELPAAALVFRLRSRRELSRVALVNVLTNPVMNLLLALEMTLAGSDSIADPWSAVTLAALELAVFIAEWALLARLLPERRALAPAISGVLNAASLAVGLALIALG